MQDQRVTEASSASTEATVVQPVPVVDSPSGEALGVRPLASVVLSPSLVVLRQDQMMPEALTFLEVTRVVAPVRPAMSWCWEEPQTAPMPEAW